jgi:hypothetical protein
VTPTPTATLLPGDAGPLRFTLAWTDYRGEPSAAKALVNDLDLEVIGPDGTHYRGNAGVYSSGQCLRSGGWDGCNTVEGVIVPNARRGDYQVIVHGANVPNGPQPFAVVASGANIRTAGPVETHQLYLPLIRR